MNNKQKLLRKRKKRPLPFGDEGAIAPTAERAAHAQAGGGSIEIAEPERTTRGGAKAYVDADGRPSRPWRVVDSLATMERLGSIDANQRAAGERFRACFERAGHAGASAAKLIRIGGRGGDGGLEARVRAGEALANAKRILGGRGPLVSVCVAVLGLGQSLRTYDAGAGQRRGRAAAMLRKALEMLVKNWR